MKTTLERYLFNKAYLSNIPVNASVELLPLCNMNCIMCYTHLSQSEVRETGSHIMTGTEWTAIGQALADMGCVFLMITGGEPLLHPDFKQIYLDFQKRGFIITINTNGTLIDESWISFFKENPPRRMNITLYGTSPESYEKICHYRDGYRKTVDAIRRLREEGIAIKINGTLIDANKEEYREIIDLAKKYGCGVNIDTHIQPVKHGRGHSFQDDIRLSPEEAAEYSLKIYQYQYGREMYQEYVRQTLELVENYVPDQGQSGLICQAAHSSLAINWQGYLRPCIMLIREQRKADPSGLKENWEEMCTSCNNLQLSPKCRSCRLRGICITCAASAYHETGHYEDTPEYLCRYTEKLYEFIQTEKKNKRNVIEMIEMQ